MIKKENYEVLYQGIKSGLNITSACRNANISTETYHKKYKHDANFRLKIDQALIAFEQMHILNIQKAALSDTSKWTASAWILERRFPEDWAIKQKVEHSGTVILNFDKQDGKL